ncbi:MAG: ABC transporter permease subunit [candidate division Zixibacteria bacterium]|nr:ABC transporter permease subunit [candidate division Zixibacteria bacterium]
MFGGFISDVVGSRLSELLLRTGEHVILTGISTGIAISLGIPLGILAVRIRWLRGTLTGAVGILQTIPSLAMLAILLALLEKIGTVPAIIALVMYALLPIVRNTLAGIEGVSPSVLEAARGIGMTPRQRLSIVEVPLALPVIVAGIRTAAVVGVGIATLSAFIGAGGLGQFINRGLALSNTNLILLGAIPAAILALLVDAAIATSQWGIEYKKKGDASGKISKRVIRILAILAPLFIVIAGLAAYYSQRDLPLSSAFTSDSDSSVSGSVTIATKNFTEQFILGELMTQIVEDRTNIRVNKKFNLGGTMICHGALVSNAIDLYAEYTGTALTAILNKDVIPESGEVLELIKQSYRERFDARWLPPFGFNNTYAITVRKEDAKRYDLTGISDLAPIADELTAGFTAEFVERPDGFPGLRKEYGLEFAQVIDLDPSIMYQAVSNGEVDVICAFATDGRIAAYNLQPLEDDSNFFPAYYAAPVVRSEVLETYPELETALKVLAGILNDKTMQELNYEVDEEKRQPSEVARDFLKERDLIG